MTELTAVHGDITAIEVDAIVNAANSRLAGGGGVDGAIHAVGGPSILSEGRRIVAERGPLPAGQAVATGAGRLPARIVVHTVGPVWGTVPEGEAEAVLASCYISSLDVAVQNGCRRISFPAISTGVYRFPKDRACRIAVGAVREWTSRNPQALDRVLFVCFSEDDYDRYLAQLGE